MNATTPKLPPMPDVVERVLRRAGKTRREVSNPGITARETIVLANWIVAREAAQSIEQARELSDEARDAARYRWLRDALNNEQITARLHEAFQQGSTALDAAIDAARSPQTGKEA